MKEVIGVKKIDQNLINEIENLENLKINLPEKIENPEENNLNSIKYLYEKNGIIKQEKTLFDLSETFKEKWGIKKEYSDIENFDLSINNLKKEYREVLRNLVHKEKNPENLEKLEKYCMEELELNRKQIMEIGIGDDISHFSISLFLTFAVWILLTTLNITFNIIPQIILLSITGFSFIGFMFIFYKIESNEKGILMDLRNEIFNKSLSLQKHEENEKINLLNNKYS